MRALVFFCFFLTLTATACALDQPEPLVGGYPSSEALQLGERLYRQGLLPSGEPSEAIVQIDIPVDGTMFSCESCHLRSGLGSIEGKVVTLPTNATELFKPFTSAAEENHPSWQTVPDSIKWTIRRPAYTDETLARAIWTGINPEGQELNWSMPRYNLEERDMEILVYYLKNLSNAPSPGVSDTAIRFATVVSDTIPVEERNAMLDVIQTYFRDRSGQMRRQEERAVKGPFYRKKRTTAYRRLELSIWELHGPPDTWRGQLEKYYQEQPVFALVGGMARPVWQPIHEFCEEHRIPAILPITDYPVVNETDWYTLYFSKGYYQEGEASARFLSRSDAPDRPVVQIYRNDSAGQSLARGFRETRQRLNQLLPADIALDPGQKLDSTFWKQLAGQYSGAVYVLWLDADDLQEVAGLAGESPSLQLLITSYSLLENRYDELPESILPLVRMTYPYRLPDQSIKHREVIRNWLRFRKVPIGDPMIQSKMYFLGWLLSNALMMTGNDYYRDYFLDSIDMMNDETYAIAVYPRLSFGPGQRYASKGCHIVKIAAGGQLDPVTDWVIH
jgi:hypothetical protein